MAGEGQAVSPDSRQLSANLQPHFRCAEMSPAFGNGSPSDTDAPHTEVTDVSDSFLEFVSVVRSIYGEASLKNGSGRLINNYKTPL